MKVLERIIIVLFVMTLVVFVGVQAYDRVLIDRTAPVISCSSDVLEVSVYDDESALLQGVTARDDRDGDLTASVMINGVTGLITSDTAKVTYIVFDSSNNMATCSRRIRYTDYSKPEFSLSRPLVYSVGKTISLLDRLTATDTLDGDLSDKIRVTAQDISTQYEGVYSITVQVTNSMGDTASLPLKVVVSNSAASRQLVMLSSYIVYVDEGTAFDPAGYITSVRTSTSTAGSVSDVQINSNVDTATPGNYEVSYTYVSGGTGYTAYLAVVVR